MENYFDLYQIPVSFAPDQALIKQKFYAFSKQFHPDRFAQADDATKAEALRQAAANNEAYKTFSNTDRTMAYVLRLQGIVQEEEQYNLPPDFLMEMIDLNELLSDYEDAPDNADLKKQAEIALTQQFADWDAAVKPLLENYSTQGDDEALLIRIKDFYFRKKYLLRIQERLITFASR